jgi:hypothetical protein
LQLAAPLRARAALRDTLSPSAQREDLTIVKRVLDESHVGLHWHQDRRTYLRNFDHLVQLAAAPAEPRMFRLRLTRFVAALGHGHTTVEPTTSGVGYRLRRLASGSACFPLGLRVLSDRLFVARDLSASDAIGAGAEILAVNGVAARDLLRRMEALISADGKIASFRRYQLGPGWRFQDLQQLLFGPRDSYRVRFCRLDGRASTIDVPAATPEQLIERHAQRFGRPLDSYGPAVAYERRGRTGILRLGSFYEGLLGPASKGFAAEYAAAFGQIASDPIETLVLDLRSNEGGNNDCVSMVYAFLADRPFRFAQPTILRSNTISGLAYVESPPEDLTEFSTNPSKFVEPDSTYGWVLRPEYAQPRDYAPNATPYSGPLRVLTDGGSFSATGGLLDLLHRYHRREGRDIQFLGEAPGVDTRLGWGSGGQSLNVRLPNSGLQLAIPLLGSRNHFGSAPIPVSLPDRILAPLPGELAGQTDSVLSRAIA